MAVFSRSIYTNPESGNTQITTQSVFDKSSVRMGAEFWEWEREQEISKYKPMIDRTCIKVVYSGRARRYERLG